MLPEKFLKIKKYITIQEDNDLLEEINDADIPLTITIIFLAKESLYKAIYPLYGKYFGFSDAFIKTVDFNDKTFTISIKTETDDLKPFAKDYHGQFELKDNLVIISIEIPAY
jgi:4'-phosphopantetheinyl transferase EntD